MSGRERTTAGRVRIHVAMPKQLVEEVDAVVGPRKRSQFVTEAVERELRRVRLKAAVADVAGSLSGVDIPAWESSEAAAEWVRSMRREWDRPDEGVEERTS
jgi:metal-responsive CopG/Arc/MetJ family transcriptional regulator